MFLFVETKLNKNDYNDVPQNNLRKGSWSAGTDGEPPTSSLFSGMYFAVVPFDLRMDFLSRRGFYGGMYSGC
jgi:hypothetical protein